MITCPAHKVTDSICNRFIQSKTGSVILNGIILLGLWLMVPCSSARQVHEDRAVSDQQPGLYERTPQNPLQAATQWLKQVDTGDSDRVWENSHADVHACIEKDPFVMYLVLPRVWLGSLVRRTLIHEDFLPDKAVRSQDEVWILEFVTEFVNEKEMSELVTLARDQRGAIRVRNYYIGKRDRNGSVSENKKTKISKYHLPLFDTNSIGMSFTYIPPGTFDMGLESKDVLNAYPKHSVEITWPFYLGIHEVTQAQYHRILNTNPSTHVGDNLPVENVSWEDAVAFCRKLSQMEGVTYRLPTEAEWEHACRTDDDGLRTLKVTKHKNSFAWNRSNANSTTHPVGSKLPNPWGLYDMLGNVWEWCWDKYGHAYYRFSPDEDPQGVDFSTQLRSRRGGAFTLAPKKIFIAIRSSLEKDKSYKNTGFRVVKEIPKR